MNNSLKVAQWELKRNLKNKTFLISMFITPLLMIVFGFLPTLIHNLEAKNVTTVNIMDEVGIYEQITENLSDNERLEIKRYSGTAEDLEQNIRDNPSEYFMVISQSAISESLVPIYSTQDGFPDFTSIETAINSIIRDGRLEELGLEGNQIDYINQSFFVSAINIDSQDEDFFVKVIPAVLAGFILIAISITGIMTFQSSIGEKKDKMTEILLSSVSCDNLMQGKILGYFVLGLMQALIFIIFAIPIAQYNFDIPVLSYLLNPILILMIVYALLGYLMLSALFVSFGATVEDIQEAGNFHSILFILPWLPFLVIGPIVSSPNGMIARIVSYFPFTAPGVMLFRLTLLSKIPVTDVIISLAILIVTTLLIMKMAGKIFKTGMLMTGKNASIQEIWKWVRR